MAEDYFFYQGHGDYSRPTLGILWLQQLEVHILLPFLCNSKNRRLTPFLHPYRQRSARAALAPSDMQLFRRHVFHVHRDIGIKIILLYALDVVDMNAVQFCGLEPMDRGVTSGVTAAGALAVAQHFLTSAEPRVDFSSICPRERIDPWSFLLGVGSWDLLVWCH